MYIDLVQKIDRIIWVWHEFEHDMFVASQLICIPESKIKQSGRVSHHFPDRCRLGMSLCAVKRLCQERQGRGVWDMDQLISNGMPGALGGNQLELIHGHLTQIFLSQSHECSDWRVGELPMFFLQFWENVFFLSEHGWIEVFSSRRMALVSWIAWLAVYFGGMGCWYIRSYLVMASDDVI